MQERFGEEDRKRVVSEIERAYGLKLFRIAKWRKYFRDQKNSRYIILGGFGDWHGIDHKIFESEEKATWETSLFLAKQYPRRIDVFSCDFKALLRNKRALTLTERKLYEFNLEPTSGGFKVREVPGVILKKVLEMSLFGR